MIQQNQIAGLVVSVDLDPLVIELSLLLGAGGLLMTGTGELILILREIPCD